MTSPRLDADGRVQLTDALVVEPDEVVIQTSWSTETTRRFGVWRRATTWWHVELRSGTTRVRARARVTTPPEGTVEKAAPHDAELDVGTLETLVARLRELGARDARVIADLASSLVPEDVVDEDPPEEVESAEESAEDADIEAASASASDRVREPVLAESDQARYAKNTGLVAGFWGLVIVGLWAVVVPRLVGAGAHMFPVAVGVPATLVVARQLRAALGYTIVLPFAPTTGWLPQRFGERRRVQAPEVGDHTLDAAPYWVVWFGFWLSLAQAFGAFDAPPLLVVVVGVALCVAVAIDVRREWRTASLVRALLRRGTDGRSANRQGPSSSVEVKRESRGSGRYRSTRFALRESVTCPNTLTVWQDGAMTPIATEGATLLSSFHAEIADGHSWRVPRGASVRWFRTGGAPVLFATVCDEPARELRRAMVGFWLYAVGLSALAIGSVVWALVA